MDTTQTTQTKRTAGTHRQNDGIIDVRTFGSLGLHLATNTTTPTKVRKDDPVAPSTDDSSTSTDTGTKSPTTKTRQDDPTPTKLIADEPIPTS